MARTGTIQPSFSSGEISPRLFGRTDIAKYGSSAESIENFLVRPEGGLMRRHGLRFSGEVSTHTKVARGLPFIYSTVQAYSIIFEDLLIRFYKDNAPVTMPAQSITNITQANPAVLTYSGTDSYANGDRVLVAAVGGMTEVNNREFVVANLNAGAKTFELFNINSTGYTAYTSNGTVSEIYTITSPYLEADLPSIAHTQSADTLYLVHPSYAPRTLTRAAHTSWTLSQLSLTRGPFAPFNTDDSIRVRVSGTSYRTGASVTISANSNIFSTAHVGGLFYIREIYLDQIAVYPYGNDRANNVQAVVGAQFSNAGNVYQCVAVVGANLAGQVFPVHTEGDAWDAPVGSTNRAKFRYLHSRTTVLQITTFSDAKTMTATVLTYCPDGLDQPSKAITGAVSSGGKILITSVAHGYADGDYVQVAAVGGTVEANGYWRITYVSADTFTLDGSAFVNAYTAATGTVVRFSSWLWRQGAFSTARGFPAAVTLHEQRLCFANTASQPFGFWASESGNFVGFLPGTTDDATIDYNIAANQADPVRWLSAANDIIVGTLSQEFAGVGGGLGDPITPANTRFIGQSAEGSNGVQPVKVSNGLLFCNRSGRKIFALNYDTGPNAYTSVDLLELAEHLATSTNQITRIAWAKNPASLLWCLRTDGSLISMTYRPDQQVVAWARQIINGFIESIWVIPSSNGSTDQLWMIVRRTINGNTRRYVEYLSDPFEPTSATDKNTMGFVDSGLSYSGAATSTLSGLFHLEGQTVKVVVNGALHPDCLVTNGRITLVTPATNAWVGLAYTSRLRTVRPEGAAIGTAQGKTKRTPRVTVRVLNAIGGTIGAASEATMDEFVRRGLSDPMDASPPMFTGDVDCFLPSDFDLAGQIAIVQADPLPLDILGLMPLNSVSEG